MSSSYLSIKCHQNTKALNLTKYFWCKIWCPGALVAKFVICFDVRIQIRGELSREMDEGRKINLITLF